MRSFHVDISTTNAAFGDESVENPEEWGNWRPEVIRLLKELAKAIETGDEHSNSLLFDLNGHRCGRAYSDRRGFKL